jgi:hypothetical protein
MCILLTQQGIILDYIIFSDTLAEKPETYEYINYFNFWLNANGQPSITVLEPYRKEGLEGECLRLKRLPSIVYGYKSCSEKWKIRPYEAFVKRNNITFVNKYVGYDADEEHRAKNRDSSKQIRHFPLIEADLGRFECEKLIRDTGLIVPPKSSCFFCPSSRVNEIQTLATNNKPLFDRAVNMERNAVDTLITIKGLARNRTWQDIGKQTILNFNPPQISCECGL